MTIDTRRLDRQVEKYKKAKNNREKEAALNEIVKVLTHHIRAIRQFLLGDEMVQNISPAVKKIVLSNMKSTTNIQDTDEFLYYLKQNVQLAGYTKDDINQLIMLHLVKLLNEYKYQKLSFLHFATYLLPRRVMQEIWKTTKDQLQQMHTLMDVSSNNEFIEKIQLENCDEECLDDSNYVEQYEILIEQFNSQVSQQFIRHKRREKDGKSSQARNSSDAGLDLS